MLESTKALFPIIVAVLALHTSVPQASLINLSKSNPGVTLQSFLNGGSYGQVGDKKFHDFVFEKHTGTTNPYLFDLSKIQVNSYQDANGYGLKFTDTGTELESIESSPGNWTVEQISFSFSVTATDANKRIKDIELITNAATPSWWTTAKTVDFDVMNDDHFFASSFKSSQNPAHDVFNPQQTVKVYSFSQADQGSHINSYTLTFSQVAVPEPSTLALSLLGLLGLVMMDHRKLKSQLDTGVN